MKKIIISGINLVEGGTLTIFKEVLGYLDRNLSEKYEIIALVHCKKLFEKAGLINIKFLEFPKAKKNWIIRCWYEYYYFNKLSKQLKPYLWLSLHDVTPNVESERLAVYCHNPTPFFKMKFRDIKYDKKLYLFSKFYKYLYRINIKKNNYVIVQQSWIAKQFREMYSIKNLLVAPPKIESQEIDLNRKNNIEKNSFFYPAYPRIFKNFEIICQAAEYLEKEGVNNFKVYLTIDGTENLYSSEIVKKYKKLKTIEFIGLLSREEVYKYYSKVECLIFPSKLETWGLPITEFKNFNKPIIAADLEYAYETVGDYEKVIFFKPESKNELASKMLNIIKNDKIEKYKENRINFQDKIVDNWDNLFRTLLKKEKL